MMWAVLSTVIFSVCTSGMTIQFVPPAPGLVEAEGFTPEPALLIASFPAGQQFDRTGWAYTTDSEQAGMGRYNAMDNNPKTIWHSMYSPVVHELPHTMTIDMKTIKNIDGIRYHPRQDGSKNGNIGQHKIYTSTDCINFSNMVSYGTWADDATPKSSAFELHPARCVRIEAITEAGNRGPWSSASEFFVYGGATYTKPNPSLGLWGPTIDFPLVPVAAAVEPDTGNLQTWSSWASDTFGGAQQGQTLTSLWNPTTKIVTKRLVTDTKHDMFCPGTSFDATGRVVITGGDSSLKTSFYTGGSDKWTAGPNMNTGRGYQSQVTMGDGRIFVIGGSWSGSTGDRNGEIYSPTSNKWTPLANCPVRPMLTADTKGTYRADNHGWLFNWKNGYVFQAGPSKQMNWYNTAGNGGQSAAGNRGNDGHAMCGNAVMYDASLGKVLSVGGSPDYANKSATTNANIITIGNPNTAAAVAKINPMWFPRIFHNSVALPNGQVFITGGQKFGHPFFDTDSILTPEMWNPDTNAFVRMTPNSIPRNYHSIALLLIDATVISCGGGLCGTNDPSATCSGNHFDCQVFTPPYLLNADGSKKARPTITSISARSNKAGATITVKTGGAVKSFAMIRYATTTHTVNTDQRRIPLTPVNAGTNTYKVTLGPANTGQVTPGYWMLFAIDNSGVPSIATTLLMQT